MYSNAYTALSVSSKPSDGVAGDATAASSADEIVLDSCVSASLEVVGMVGMSWWTRRFRDEEWGMGVVTGTGNAFCTLP